MFSVPPFARIRRYGYDHATDSLLLSIMFSSKWRQSSISRSFRWSSTRLTFSSVRAVRRRPLPVCCLQIQSYQFCVADVSQKQEISFFLGNSATNLLAPYTFFQFWVFWLNFDLLLITFCKSCWKRRSVAVLCKKNENRLNWTTDFYEILLWWPKQMSHCVR